MTETPAAMPDLWEGMPGSWAGVPET